MIPVPDDFVTCPYHFSLHLFTEKTFAGTLSKQQTTTTTTITALRDAVSQVSPSWQLLSGCWLFGGFFGGVGGGWGGGGGALFVCLFFFCVVFFCFVFVLFCWFLLFCFVLFCFVLLCFVLFCFVLFCLRRNVTSSREPRRSRPNCPPRSRPIYLLSFLTELSSFSIYHRF